MDSFLVYSICCWLVLSADGVNVTLEMNSSLPLKGSSLELSCRLSEPFDNDEAILIWKGLSKVTTCVAGSSYLCEFYNTSYSFTANSSGVFGSISSLNTEAEGTWRCSYKRAPEADIYSNSRICIVYTIPSGLSVTQNPDQNIDLSVQSVVLQCKTTGCTYPMPTVQWNFQGQTTSSEIVYITSNTTGIQETCAAQEKVYTSTLNIPQYTTLNDNSDKTGTFSCKIEYPDPSRNIMASASHTVRFAVRVTEVVLQQNNQNITDILTVTSAELVTLTCITGTSRPDPTIDWYTGSQKRGSGPSLTIAFSNMDHNETIYCQAYNTNYSSLVSSKKPKLYVKVRVTEVVLQQKSENITETLNVTSGETVTLTCVTGTSRPASTIDWYIESQNKGSGSDLTINVSSTDHNKMIYCQAYNIDLSRPVFSAKPRLVVRGPPQTVNKFYVTRLTENQIELQFEPGFNGGYVQSFVIQYKSTNESDMAWTNSSVADLKEMQIQLHNGVCFVSVTQPGLGKYMFRMYSWNEKGRSPFSAEITVTLTEVNEQQGQSGPSIAGIAGGIGAAAVVIAAIVLVLVVIKRRKTGKSNVEIYEDATILKRSTSKETTYENSNVKIEMSANKAYQTSAETAAKGPGLNRDGLLYADLKLGPPSPKGRKPVIHPLEERTVYADIDYGKRGKPQPESDKGKESGEARKNGTQS